MKARINAADQERLGDGPPEPVLLSAVSTGGDRHADGSHAGLLEVVADGAANSRFIDDEIAPIAKRLTIEHVAHVSDNVGIGRAKRMRSACSTSDLSSTRCRVVRFLKSTAQLSSGFLQCFITTRAVGSALCPRSTDMMNASSAGGAWKRVHVSPRYGKLLKSLSGVQHLTSIEVECRG